MFGERIRVCFVLSREFYIVQSKNTYKPASVVLASECSVFS